MATLFIIDQSLTDTGGHHFDYTNLVARAAREQGMATVIGANRKIRPAAAERLSELGEFANPFRETTYTALSHLSGLRILSDRGPDERRPSPDNGRLANWVARRAQMNRIRTRGRLIRQFAEDCEAFFSGFSFDDDDHVLFTTMSELDFMGLAAYLSNHPRTLQASWHVQFHFSIFSGRPSEFELQSRTEDSVFNCFQSALARVPYHAIRAWTTSGELAEQYNRMRLMTFNELAWPLHPELTACQSDEIPQRALRMTVAGGIRREKGQKQYLAQLVDRIWDSQLAAGKLVADIQSGNPRNFSRSQLLSPKRARTVKDRQFRDVVRIHQHPLPQSEYVNLIGDSDIGLVYYDSHRYYARRAGILSEFLAAGKPVIVPAGCWLSQQVSEACARHIEQVIDDSAAQCTMAMTDLGWDQRNVPHAGGIITFDSDRNPFECTLHRDKVPVDKCRIAVLQFGWRWPSESGSFVNITLNCFDNRGQLIGSDNQIVTMRPQGDGESIAMFQLPAEFATAELVLRNAYLDSAISLADGRVTFLDPGDQGLPPRGAVGVVAADEESLASAVDEMVTHYPHYRKTAVEFARRWSANHDPQLTVETLIGRSQPVRRAA